MRKMKDSGIAWTLNNEELGMRNEELKHNRHCEASEKPWQSSKKRYGCRNRELKLCVK